jgi:hypothetical protein
MHSPRTTRNETDYSELVDFFVRLQVPRDGIYWTGSWFVIPMSTKAKPNPELNQRALPIWSTGDSKDGILVKPVLCKI